MYIHLKQSPHQPSCGSSSLFSVSDVGNSKAEIHMLE